MSANMSKEEEFKLARKMQDLFRDAIKAVMDGNIVAFESTTQRFLESHEGCTVEDMIVDFQSEGKTLLHIAASSGKFDILEYLLASCSNENLEQLQAMASAPGAVLASSKGNAENIAKLKRLVNLKDHRGFTPLINATAGESEESMRLLLRLGAEANARNDDGACAAHFAASDGSLPRLKLLAEYGATFDQQSKSGTPLHWAAGKGRDVAIAFLVANAKGVNINTISPEGLPPVLMAAVASADEGVRALVEAGADIGMIVSGQLTTLHICAEHGLTAAVEAILATETGLRCVDLRTSEGNTPLMLAMMGGHREVIQILLAKTSEEDKTTLFASATDADRHSMSTELDFLVKEGHRLLQEWHAQHELKQNHEAQEALALAPEAASCARFDAITCPEKSPEVVQQADALKDQANEHYKHGVFPQAIECYTKAIALDKTNHVYWSNRSACYLTMKQNHDALLDAEICRRLSPDWPKGCYRLAAARLAEGLFEDAALAAFEGCKLDNNNEELKAILQKAVRLGQEDYRRSQTKK